MDDRSVLIDTSIFIEYFRKENKKRTKLYILTQEGYELTTSSICYFEYMAGSKDRAFDRLLFENVKVIPFDKNQAHIASTLFKKLKEQNQIIEFRDILISACAIAHNTPLATLNFKHFGRIDGLSLLDS
jgi:predicted nucleic acid-binding protein